MIINKQKYKEFLDELNLNDRDYALEQIKEEFIQIINNELYYIDVEYDGSYFYKIGDKKEIELDDTNITNEELEELF